MIDLFTKEKNNLIFHHQSYQLWEQTVKTQVLHKTKDLQILNKKGITLMHLGTKSKRLLKDSLGFEVLLHSLESYNYLKVDPGNFLKFNCLDEEEQYIGVEQEYTTNNPGGQNVYEQIFKVRIK